MTTILLTKSDVDRVITAHLADELCIELEANPTTGFEWQLDPSDVSIKVLGEEFLMGGRADEGRTVGAGGTQRFTIGFTQPTVATISFKYWRPWQGDGSVEIRCRFRISIEE